MSGSIAGGSPVAIDAAALGVGAGIFRVRGHASSGNNLFGRSGNSPCKELANGESDLHTGQKIDKDHLMLRSERSECLEEWATKRCPLPTLRDGRFAASSG